MNARRSVPVAAAQFPVMPFAAPRAAAFIISSGDFTNDVDVTSVRRASASPLVRPRATASSNGTAIFQKSPAHTSASTWENPIRFRRATSSAHERFIITVIAVNIRSFARVNVSATPVSRAPACGCP